MGLSYIHREAGNFGPFLIGLTFLKVRKLDIPCNPTHLRFYYKLTNML